MRAAKRKKPTRVMSHAGDGLDLDTSGLMGGPIMRNGAKGRIVSKISPHFAKANVFAEPFFGAGSVFFGLQVETYERWAINDLDASLMTFFRVLRDRTEDLVRVCELTPYSRDEFIAALSRSDDELEEARRVWIRYRQGFAGAARTDGDWGRNPGYSEGWNPSKAESKLAALRAYAARLRTVAIDAVDAVEFIDKWGQESTFIYEDPPYLLSVCSQVHEHTMTEHDHRRLAFANHEAVARGCHIAISGYPSRLYDQELYASWRRIEIEVALHGTREARGQRRTEVLWLSYSEEQEISYRPRGAQMSMFARDVMVVEEPARAAPDADPLRADDAPKVDHESPDVVGCAR